MDHIIICLSGFYQLPIGAWVWAIVFSIAIHVSVHWVHWYCSRQVVATLSGERAPGKHQSVHVYRHRVLGYCLSWAYAYIEYLFSFS
jgi:hypothetical protein